ncbi:Plastid movement impaired protein [Heracleum sosnowskyi]|uniref:Plastid movement impaired protein n=1 Tax=Heracleum sosnowskyi TaxID=360622 RepID=A0AAD8MG37_9APIA|nr:Plastid movement impaired protein [Heracleum sosnowskyi]
MGNTLGGKKTIKIMKINGETFKLKTPVEAGEVTKDYPGFVLLESEAVKHFGIRAKPLGVHQQLKAKRLYFLVELPKFPQENAPRKVRSGIIMSAKDRLDSLMLARRSVSDLSLLQPKSNIIEEGSSENGSKTRIKMRLPKADVEKLMRESKNEAEAAEKIMQLYLNINSNDEQRSSVAQRRISTGGLIARQRRGGFMPINEGEIQVAVA